VISQCSMRHLYAAASEPGVSYLIDKAKLFERRRCGHLPEDYPTPLSAVDCISAVVDPKGSKTNKHRYVIASQDQEVRKAMRGVLGVPLIYINRSVMIMEPMAEASAESRERGEKSKFRDGLKRGSGSLAGKRKREDGADDGGNKEGADNNGETPKKKKKFGGPKGPNPLAVKKSKKRTEGDAASSKAKEDKPKASAPTEGATDGADGADGTGKRKRRRKHKSSAEGATTEGDAGVQGGDGGGEESA
jgi:U3 small nucleolar RNA-associated protein 23